MRLFSFGFGICHSVSVLYCTMKSVQESSRYAPQIETKRRIKNGNEDRRRTMRENLKKHKFRKGDGVVQSPKLIQANPMIDK